MSSPEIKLPYLFSLIVATTHKIAMPKRVQDRILDSKCRGITAVPKNGFLLLLVLFFIAYVEYIMDLEFWIGMCKTVPRIIHRKVI